METLPGTPSLAYSTLWFVVGAGLAVLLVLLAIIELLHEKTVTQTAAKPSNNQTKPNRQATVVTAATTKKYIQRLQDLLDSPNPPPTQSIYAALSFIIRQYVDAIHGTNTVTMSNQEVRHLAVDQSLTAIIDECYAVEFSPNHGSVEQCRALLVKSKEYIG